MTLPLHVSASEYAERSRLVQLVAAAQSKADDLASQAQVLRTVTQWESPAAAEYVLAAEMTNVIASRAVIELSWLASRAHDALASQG